VFVHVQRPRPSQQPQFHAEPHPRDTRHQTTDRVKTNWPQKNAKNARKFIFAGVSFFVIFAFLCG
jgi:hypothetical protein